VYRLNQVKARGGIEQPILNVDVYNGKRSKWFFFQSNIGPVFLPFSKRTNPCCSFFEVIEQILAAVSLKLLYMYYIYNHFNETAAWICSFSKRLKNWTNVKLSNC